MDLEASALVVYLSGQAVQGCNNKYVPSLSGLTIYVYFLLMTQSDAGWVSLFCMVTQGLRPYPICGSVLLCPQD